MDKLQRKSGTPQYVPNYIARSLLEVDFELLKENGVRFIAFDADSTLVHFRGKVLAPKVKEFLLIKRDLFEDWCIASNRITNDLLPLAESMEAQVVRATLTNRKPQQRYFRQVIRLFGGKPGEIAMIGDKLIADVWGANNAGMVTVWVEKIGPDSIWDRVLRTRTWERRLINRYLPENIDK
jgi:uncharacterized protein